jgi:hypothetical protein
VHLIMDNYGTHKVAKVRNWLVRHPRYHAHSHRPAQAGSIWWSDSSQK